MSDPVVIDLSTDTPARRAFERLAAGPDAAMDLAEGALLIEAAERGEDGADPTTCLTWLDRAAAAVNRSVPPGADTPGKLMALHHVLFEELGFRGDEEDYYAPENAWLTRVVARRRGLPILLAVVYVEIARRVGVDASGVGFPGHFLVRATVEDGFVVIDPFFGGRILDLEGCVALYRQTAGEDADFHMSFLDTAGPRDILSRILSNLRHMHLRRGDSLRALRAQDWLVCLNPDALEPRLERARLFESLGAFPAAVEDLEFVAEHVDDPMVLARLDAHLATLRPQGANLN